MRAPLIINSPYSMYHLVDLLQLKEVYPYHIYLLLLLAAFRGHHSR